MNRAQLCDRSAKRCERKEILDSENKDCGRRRLRQCARRLLRGIGRGYWNCEEVRRRRPGNCGKINPRICRLHLDHRVPLPCGGNFLVAAAVRSWHTHASALALHLLAARAFRGTQMRARQSTRHGWGQQWQQHRQYQRELAHRLHGNFNFTPVSQIEQSVACCITGLNMMVRETLKAR